jgi:hypothetical protein
MDPMTQWTSGRFKWGKLDTNRIQVCSLKEIQGTLEPGEEIYQLHPREFLYRPSSKNNNELTASSLQGGADQTTSNVSVSHFVHRYAARQLAKGMQTAPGTPLAARSLFRSNCYCYAS